MKKCIVYLIGLITIVLVLSSCVTQNMDYISKDFELYGTWVNPDYYEGNRPGCMVFKPDNILEDYDTHKKIKLRARYWYAITNKWIDRNGIVWYTGITLMSDSSWSYQLLKISESGKTLETAFAAIDYPNEINPSSIGTSYSIYYRENYHK